MPGHRDDPRRNSLLKLGRHREAERELRSLVDDMQGRDHEAEELKTDQARFVLALVARGEKTESLALPLFDAETAEMIGTAAAAPDAGYGGEAARLRTMLAGGGAGTR